MRTLPDAYARNECARGEEGEGGKEGEGEREGGTRLAPITTIAQFLTTRIDERSYRRYVTANKPRNPFPLTIANASGHEWTRSRVRENARDDIFVVSRSVDVYRISKKKKTKKRGGGFASLCILRNFDTYLFPLA